MAERIKLSITTSDGKTHKVSEENINKYGMDAYAKAYKGATIWMQDDDGADYDIPLEHYASAVGQGLKAYMTMEASAGEAAGQASAQAEQTAAQAAQETAQSAQGKTAQTSAQPQPQAREQQPRQGQSGLQTPPTIRQGGAAAPAEAGSQRQTTRGDMAGNGAAADAAAAGTGAAPAASADAAAPADAADAAAEGGAQGSMADGAAESTWQPDEQERIRMAADIEQELDRAKRGMQGVTDRFGRIADRYTAEGRSAQKRGEMQARLAGAPTRVMGMVRPDEAAEAAAPKTNSQVGDGAGRPMQSGQGPVAYGVEYVDGKAKTRWLMPDGSVTTDIAAAEQSEYGARQQRLANEFLGRMRKNGLDAGKAEDVLTQQAVDAITSGIGDGMDAQAYEQTMAYMRANGLDTKNPQHAMWAVNGDERSVVEYQLRRNEERLKELNAERERWMQEHGGGGGAAAFAPGGVQSYNGGGYSSLSSAAYPKAAEIRRLTDMVAAQESALRRYDQQTEASGKGWLSKFGQGLAEGVSDPNTWTFGAYDASGAEALRGHTAASAALNLRATAPDAGGWYNGARFAGEMLGDPVTYASLGLGAAAGSLTNRAAARVMMAKGFEKGVAERMLSQKLLYRMGNRAVSTGANLAAFEGLRDARQQLMEGGWTDNRGNRHEGFSLEHAIGQGGHGFMLGSTMGIFGAGFGNVGHWAVNKAGSAAGKVGAKATVAAADFAAEGTIFAAPEIYEFHTMSDEAFDKQYAEHFGYDKEKDPAKRAEKRAEARGSMKWNAWGESLAMLGGMKGAGKMVHPIQTVAGVRSTLAEMRRQDARDHRTFGERVKMMMDRSPLNMELTAEEKEEIEYHYYGLADMLKKERKSKLMGENMETGMRDVHVEDMGDAGRDPKLDGYSEVERLMSDPNVSQAARAKVYYLVTGNLLPMRTVTGYTREESDGQIIVSATGAGGEVITRRKFGRPWEKASQRDKAAADRAVREIERQAELNTIDMGEQYAEQEVKRNAARRMYESVGARYNLIPDAIEYIYERHLRGENLSEAERNIAKDVESSIEGMTEGSGIRPEAIRERVESETGVDVDKALGKLAEERSEGEREAVRLYAERLYSEGERERKANDVWDKAYGDWRDEYREERRRAWQMRMSGRLLYGRAAAQGQGAGTAPAEAGNHRQTTSGEMQGGKADEAARAAAQAEIDAALERYKEAEAALDEAFGGDEALMYQAQTDPWTLLGNSDLTESEREAVVNLINAGEYWRGIEEARSEAHAAKEELAAKAVGKRMHQDEGAVISATMKNGDRKVYIIKGHVESYADGSGVDAAQSDGMIIVMDAASGMIETTSADRILRVDGMLDVQSEIDAELERMGVTSEAGAEAPEPETNFQMGEGAGGAEAPEPETDFQMGEGAGGAEAPEPETDFQMGEGAGAGQPEGNGAAPMSEEEKVIRGGIAGVGEGLRDAFEAERERICNEWLDNPVVDGEMRKYAKGSATVEEIVERAKADSQDEGTKKRLDGLLLFDSTRQRLEGMLNNGGAEAPKPETNSQMGEGEEQSAAGRGKAGTEEQHTQLWDLGNKFGLNEARGKSDKEIEDLINSYSAVESQLTEFGRGKLEGYKQERERRRNAAFPIPSAEDVTIPEPPSFGPGASRAEGNAEGTQGSTEGTEGSTEGSGAEAPKPETNSQMGEGSQTPAQTPAAAPAQGPAAEATIGSPGQSALGRIPVDAEGEPMYEAADKETAWDGLVEAMGGESAAQMVAEAQYKAAKDELEKLMKKPPKPKAPKLGGGKPSEMKRAIDEANQANEQAKQQYQQALSAAEAKAQAWGRILTVNSERQAAERAREAQERQAAMAQAHDEAVQQFEDEQRQKAEQAAEQAAVGAHAVHPKIKEKWDMAPKAEGHKDIITLPDGSTIKGRYVLTEAGCATASHDVNQAYAPSEGFPVDANGQSVNDRDYQRDKAAQAMVEKIASNYDSRAIQTPVIVSGDGIVLSGNNRTMSGDIAAKAGTDKAYVDYLMSYGEKYGFSPEQVSGMEHPRLVFVPDDPLPYDAATFARFNAQEMKSQSKDETAVKLGKTVSEDIFGQISQDIGEHDSLSDYYRDEQAVARALGLLLESGVINDKQLPELRLGTTLSAAGKELLENVLIGKVFQGRPDAVRQVMGMPTLRQTILMGLSEIVRNSMLGNGYDLKEELAAAVDLVYKAKRSQPELYKDGASVSQFGLQMGLFDDELGESTVTNAIVLLLSDMLNSSKPSDLRKVIARYNESAGRPASGQMNLLTGDADSKEEILRNVLNQFRHVNDKNNKQPRAGESPRAGGTEQQTKTAGQAEAAIPGDAGEQPEAGLMERSAAEAAAPKTDSLRGENPHEDKEAKKEEPEEDDDWLEDDRTIDEKIADAEADVDTEPSEAQKEAGNYKKGHLTIGDFDISIENPKGSVRRGPVGADGTAAWETVMANTYGYIRGTEDADGDAMDVYLHEDMGQWDGRKVYVIDQTREDGSFDEHKVMLGFNDGYDAMQAYLANYEAGWEKSHPGLRITEVSVDDFKAWAMDGKKKTRAYADEAAEAAAPKTNSRRGNDAGASRRGNDAGTSRRGNDAGAEAQGDTGAGGKGYSITPATYEGKKSGKKTAMHRLKFDRELSREEESLVKAYASGKLTRGRGATNRGWLDRDAGDGSWLFRTEEAAQHAAELIYRPDAGADAKPLSQGEMDKLAGKGEDKPKKAPKNRVSVEDLAESLNKRGEARLSENAEPAGMLDGKEPVEDKLPQGKKRNRWISDEDADEFNGLSQELRERLGGKDMAQEPAGGYGKPKVKEMDAEVLRLGTKMTYLMMKGGLRHFRDYCEAMVEEVGDGIRPHLKSLYAAAQNMEEVMALGWDEEMDDRKTVKAYDVYNFDKAGAKDVLESARGALDELDSEQKTEQLIDELKEKRNEQRREEDEQRRADTAAIGAEADAAASQAAAAAKSGEPEKIAAAEAAVDAALDKISDQLAVLGYYEEPQAEGKAAQGAGILANKLVEDLGIDINKMPKGTDIVRANIGERYGEITMRLPRAAGAGEMRIEIELVRQAGGLGVENIILRKDEPGGFIFGESVRMLAGDITYGKLLEEINDFYGAAKAAAPKTNSLMGEAGQGLSGAEAAAPETNSLRGEAAGSEKKADSKGDKPVSEMSIFELADEAMGEAEIGKLSVEDAETYGRRAQEIAHEREFESDGIGADTVRERMNELQSMWEELTASFGEAPEEETAAAAIAAIEGEMGRWRRMDVTVSGTNDAAEAAKPETNSLMGEANDAAEAAKPETNSLKGKDAGKGEKKGGKTLRGGEKAVTLDQPVSGLFDGLEEGEKLNKPNKPNKPNKRGNDGNKTTEMGTRPEAGGGGRQQLGSDTPMGTRQRGSEAQRPAGARGGGGTGVDTGADGERGGRLPRVAKDAPLEPLIESERKNQRNNRVDRGEQVAPKSEGARIRANIEAIETLKRLQASGEEASSEDMKKLRAFSGWGGLGRAFSDYELQRRLRALMGAREYDEESQLARNSAYYTPGGVVDAMWDVALALGFRGGRVLEGSAGVGNILGLMPRELSERSELHAVEKDSTTGGILSLLYPDARVDVQGFEETKIPNGSVDLAITNVPFVPGLKVKDTTGDSDLANRFKDIHNFCIAKNVRKLREGGIGIFITTSGTLDSSGKLYRWLVNEGNSDIVGLFRLHRETFGGTNATSDIIVVKKRVNGQKSVHAIDASTTRGVRTIEFDSGKKTKDKKPIIKRASLAYNRYYVEHPEHMGGEMRLGYEAGDHSYRPTSASLHPVDGKDQYQLLRAWVDEMRDKDFGEESQAQASNMRETYTPSYDRVGNEVKTGTLVVDSHGRLAVNYDGEARPLMSALDKKNPKSESERISQMNKNKVKGRSRAQVVEDYNAVKRALSAALDYQKNHDTDEGLQRHLEALNKAYDTFVERYGHLHGNASIGWLRNDVDYPSVLALESYREEGLDHKKVYGKADIFKGRVIIRGEAPRAETVKDGVILSMRAHNRIDTDYIAQQLGMEAEEVKREIINSGIGYEDPLTNDLQPAYLYLSGNVREKLKAAEENNADGRYGANIRALREVVPPSVPAHLIEYNIGSGWLRSDLYREYIKERTGTGARLSYASGTWKIEIPKTVCEQDKAWGVRSDVCGKTIPGSTLIEAAMTNRTIRVTSVDSEGNMQTDPKATGACAAKVDEIRDDFKSWLRAKMENDQSLREEIEERYNEIFNNSAPMTIPDSYVPEYFEGASREIGGRPIKLRTHQSKAVVRGTMQSLMLAHEVGTGKTFTLITTAMELRRIGAARKPMIVVQNSTLGQFVSSAKSLYPDARILSLEEGDRNAQGRKDFYAKIRYNDWDMVIIPQSVLEKIPDHPDRERQFVQDTIEEKLEVIDAMAGDKQNWKLVGALKQQVESLRDRLSELAHKEDERQDLGEQAEDTGETGPKDKKKRAVAAANAAVRAEEMLDRKTDDNFLNFDDLGIDAILVDEAHEYKHLGFATAMQRGIKGVDPSYSKKCQGLYLKVKAVQEQNGGRNVIFATGTPISNTAAEIWTFMRYLLPKETMEAHNIWYFDDFVRNFGSIQQMLEHTPGGYKETNRFAGYSNLPELARIWAGISDTVLTEEAGEVKSQIPQLEGGQPTDIHLPQTQGLRSVIKYVKSQLRAFEEMSGQEKKENSHIPLVMYGIAKAAAIDARLVFPKAGDDPHSKTNEAVRQTLRSLKDSERYKGTVAIFADNYQRKNKKTGAVEFSLFEDIRNKLIAQGVDAEQIVIMNSGMSAKKKEKIFAMVNTGDVRVILGTTPLLGVGVNIQERLHTLMHLDAPNRPMDYWQRMGRLLRQGNLHKEMGVPVRVIRFGVEDSLDVTAYQRLKTKGAIADAVMNSKSLLENNLENRVVEEEGDEFGNITAELSGSQYAILQNQCAKELRKMRSKQDQHRQQQIHIHRSEPKYRKLIEHYTGKKKEAQEQEQRVATAGAPEITINGQTYANISAMEEVFKAHNKKMAEHKAEAEKMRQPMHKVLKFKVGDIDFELHWESDPYRFGESHQYLLSHALGHEDSETTISINGNLKRVVSFILEDIMTGEMYKREAADAESKLALCENELATLLKDKGKEFEGGEKIAELERQLEEYTALLQADMAAKEKKYAELDKTVAEADEITFDGDATEEDSAQDPEADYAARSIDYPQTYKSKDGKEIRYASERGAEGYGGLFDFDFSGERAGGEEDGVRSGRAGVRLEEDPGRSEPGGGLNREAGEYALVERVFEETGHFNFMSGERIEGPEDVAYIFEALEDAAKEHAFAVMVKDGLPTVVELGMGGFTQTMVDIPTFALAHGRIQPDEIYFVHNHPSGQLKCSAQDAQMLRRLADMTKAKVQGVIINLKSGKYGTFDAGMRMGTGEKRIPDSPEPLAVHRLDKQIFARDYDPEAVTHITGPQDVASFLNSHRMGDRGKVSFLVVSRSGGIVGNIHTPWTRLEGDMEAQARYISERVIQFGGESAILYGDFAVNKGEAPVYKRLGDSMQRLGSVKLLDVVNARGNHSRSANEAGLMEPEGIYGNHGGAEAPAPKTDYLRGWATEGGAEAPAPETDYLRGWTTEGADGNSGDAGLRFREVEDGAELEMLEGLKDDELVKTYRNVQIFPDWSLGSPMAAYDPQSGERRTIEAGRWNRAEERVIELSEEQARQLEELKATGEVEVNGKKRKDLPIGEGLKFIKTSTGAKLQYYLKRDGGDCWADYNPYDHSIKIPLNDQFAGAWKRPNLVVVESVIPKSEMGGEYKAAWARNAVGAVDWNNGRTLYLSRWSKILRILPRAEEAALIDRYWKANPDKYTGKKVRDARRFTPALRKELERLGYSFDDTEKYDIDRLGEGERAAATQGMPYADDALISELNGRMEQRWMRTGGGAEARGPETDYLRGHASEGSEGADGGATDNAAKAKRAMEIAGRLHTPIRVIETREEIEALGSERQKRAKGWVSDEGEIVIVAPNNRDVADVENTAVHEIVGHDGLRDWIGEERFGEFMDEIYGHAEDRIRGEIDARAERLRRADAERQARGGGGDAFARAKAEADASRRHRRGEYRREATEEYMADMAGRMGERGFERMSREERSLWGRIKARVQKFVDSFLRGIGLPAGGWKLSDGDLQYMLYRAWRHKRRGARGGGQTKGRASTIEKAKDTVMRRNSGWDGEGRARWRDGGGGMGLRATVEGMRSAAAKAVGDSRESKEAAVRAIGGHMGHLRAAMARQREYDEATVRSITGLAQDMLKHGLLDAVSRGEMRRILGLAAGAVGKADTGLGVRKLVDIMIDGQLRTGQNAWGRALSAKGTVTDGRGVERQGELDAEGSALARVVREGIRLPKTLVDERGELQEGCIDREIAEAQEKMGSADASVAAEARILWMGLQIARMHAEEIVESKAEEKRLRESIREAKAEVESGRMDRDSYREYCTATEEAVRENKIDRAEGYWRLIEALGGALGESQERAAAWRAEQLARIEEIHHNCNSDMTGRARDEHRKDGRLERLNNSSLVRFVLAPLATFDQMLRMLGKKSVRGEGYLWNRFMRGWVDAAEKEYIGYRDSLKELEEKVSEIWGKKMRWSDLYSLDRKLPGATVRFWDGGEQKDHELTQGNLMYIYMVNKMTDGRMKLRRMGITEAEVERIKAVLDPKLIELADWLQEDFLVKKRNEYNEVHKRMFGASMAAIENYFPLKILANARVEEVDVADDRSDAAMPATITGSIIKRRRNKLALDLTGANALSVILDHVQQMEKWAAFAEYNRDLNTMLSYKRLRNQIMNMSSAYGSGKTLWKNFKDVCSMAAGAYRPSVSALDKAAVNVAKGVTAAKVSFRMFTALKQFLSMPAYLSDSNPLYLAKNIVNPVGAWKWSMANLPLFEKRWKSRMAGDPRLMKTEMDWQAWRSKAVQAASRIGMSPNAFVDALTVSIGARAMYQTKKDKYLRWGMSEEDADRRAKQDATVLFNQTQQSSESAFLSTMQTDRSWLSVLFTVFRNSSMSYTRQLYDALRNLKHRIEPGYSGLSQEFMAKQMRRDGIDPDKAEEQARKEYRRGIARDIARVGVFGYVLQFVWNLGAYLPYLLFGDDDEEKQTMIDDVINHTYFGSIEGLTGGDVMSAAGQTWLNGDGDWGNLSKEMPIAGDLAKLYIKMGNDNVSALNDVVCLLAQSGVGVNPQSLTDAVAAVVDASGGEAESQRECALLIWRVLNCPQSQLDKLYFDELGASGTEASEMGAGEICERYARYKRHRASALTGWAYNDSTRAKAEAKYMERAEREAKRRIEARLATERTLGLLAEEAAMRGERNAARKLREGLDYVGYRERMRRMTAGHDMAVQARVGRYRRDMRELTERYVKAMGADEARAIVRQMLGCRERMLDDVAELERRHAE